MTKLKTHIVTKLKTQIVKTQNEQNSKTQIATKLKNLNCDKTKNQSCDQMQKLKFWQNLKQSFDKKNTPDNRWDILWAAFCNLAMFGWLVVCLVGCLILRRDPPDSPWSPSPTEISQDQTRPNQTRPDLTRPD